MLFRRLFLPALLATPLWICAMRGIFAPVGEMFELPSLSFVMLLMPITMGGIAAVCWPMERALVASNLTVAPRIILITLMGGAGGLLLLTAIAFRSPTFGTFGIIPGAVTALTWALLNLDLLKLKKEPTNG